MFSTVGHVRGLRVAIATSVSLLVGCAASEPTATEADPSPTVEPTSPSPQPTTPSATPTTAPPTTAAALGTIITTGASEFGDVLFDDTGQAIYLFDLEGTLAPACYDDCAVAWPPVLTEGAPAAGQGVDESLLGTTTRTDGSMQVTYAGHPLYFYAHEGKNEVLCHNITEFGGLWLAISPTGDPAPH